MHRLTWIFLVFGILQLCAAQPLYGFEKALLYSFEDPESIEWVPKDSRPVKRRAYLLNLIGQNSRFLEPYLKKKQQREAEKARQQASLNCLSPNV